MQRRPFSPLALAAAGGITLYQRYLSPHKGFSCAYRVLYGDLSCSEYIKRAFLQYPVLPAIRIARQRLQSCRLAHKRLEEGDPPVEKPRPGGRGCDLDGCDCDLDFCSDVAGMCDGLPSSCDFGSCS